MLSRFFFCRWAACLLGLVFCSAIAAAQTAPVKSGKEYIEELPEYPDGNFKIVEFIQENLQQPSVAQQAGSSGKVYVRLLIDTTGHIREASVVKGFNPECDAEALRVVRSLPKPFKPARQNGRVVECPFTVPVAFGTPSKKKRK